MSRTWNDHTWPRTTRKQLQLDFLLQYIRSSSWLASMVSEFPGVEVIHYRTCRNVPQTRNNFFLELEFRHGYSY